MKKLLCEIDISCCNQRVPQVDKPSPGFELVLAGMLSDKTISQEAVVGELEVVVNGLEEQECAGILSDEAAGSWLATEVNWRVEDENASIQAGNGWTAGNVGDWGLTELGKRAFIMGANDDDFVSENHKEENLVCEKQDATMRPTQQAKTQLFDEAKDKGFLAGEWGLSESVVEDVQRLGEGQTSVSDTKSDWVLPAGFRTEVEKMRYADKLPRATHAMDLDVLTLSDVVIKKTRSIKGISDTAITFGVRDEKFGLVHVHLVQKEGVIMGELVSSVSEVVDRLQDQLPGLVRALKDQGIMVKSLRVRGGDEAGLHEGFREERKQGENRKGRWHVARYFKNIGEQHINYLI